MVVSLAACAIGGRDRSGSVSTLPVAVDFVSVLVQLEGHSPYDTTIQFNPPTTELGRSLIEVLEIAGYGLQPVSDDQGRRYLGYDLFVEDTETGRGGTIEMRIGPVSIAREFSVRDDAWVPAGPVTLRGVPLQPIALVGSVYLHRPETALDYPSGVRFADAPDGEPGREVSYFYAYRPTGTARDAADLPAPDPRRYVRQATERLYEAGDLAFALRPSTDFAARQVLVMRFPGASDALLGAENRRALEALVRFYAADTDRLSIAACDADGRRSDASTARSGRIKAELLTLGIPGDQLVEAGCAESTPQGAATVTVERLRRT